MWRRDPIGFYSPSLGRWLSQDPLGEAGGRNLYGFVNGSPVASIDPLGLSLWGRTPTWMAPDGTLQYGTPPSEQPVVQPRRSSGNDLVDMVDEQIVELQSRSVAPVAQGIHDGAMFLLVLTPQNTFSVVFLAEDLGGEHAGLGERAKCAAMSGPGITYLGGKAWRISAALYRKVKAAKSKREIEDILKRECCKAAQANRDAEKGPYLPHVKGQAAERVGWDNAIKNKGHVAVRGPEAVAAPGPDYVTYDPASATIFVWDAKYRGPGQWGPSQIPSSTLRRWKEEVVQAVNAMPEGPDKVDALKALAAGKIQGAIFKWP